MFKLIQEYGLIKLVDAGLRELYRKLWRERVWGSYAQNWEDWEIEKILGKSTKGFYLEIGAYHPTRLSNTYRFYKHGWRGVVVEPNPAIKTIFKKIRPDDELIIAGVGTRRGKLDYYQYLIPALNTFSKEQVKINKDNGYQINGVRKIEVMTTTDLLERFVAKRKIDLLSLDVEGWDEKILEGWVWGYRPRVICVETNTEADNNIHKLLTAKGYYLKFRNPTNAIYVSATAGQRENQDGERPGWG